ncbi:MAG: undecaprenyl-diphosphatase UppP [Candidatus Kerfeldbacteria bacterium]
MDYLYSTILGLIQGLTEVFPVSSSGHLVIAHDLLNFDFVSDLSFDVALHLGTLLALVVYFYKDINKYIVSFFGSFANWDLKNNFDQRMAWYILVSTIPAGIAGFFMADIAEELLRNLWLVASMLIIFGIFFIVFEKIFKKDKELDQLKWFGAIHIGVAQAIALIPGVSRSGITIITGLAQGLKREAAARFSFLLSIPIVFGAGMKKMYDVSQTGLENDQWIILGVGFVVSAVVGYLAIRFLLKFLQKNPLNIFAYYRFVLAGVIIIYLLVR